MLPMHPGNRAHQALAVTPIALISLVVAVSVASGAFATPWSASGGSTHLGGNPLRTEKATASSPSNATCGTHNDTALSEAYAEFLNGYSGLAANVTPTPGGVPPVRISAYPNASVGGTLLTSAWTSICQSSAYSNISNLGMQQGFSQGVLFNSSNGHFDESFGLGYQLACTSNVTGSNGSCPYETAWHADLLSGNVSGPFTTSSVLPLPSTSGHPGVSLLDLLVRNGPILAALILVGGSGALVVIIAGRRGREPVRGRDPAATRGTRAFSEVHLDRAESSSETKVGGVGIPQGEQDVSEDPLSDLY